MTTDFTASKCTKLRAGNCQIGRSAAPQLDRRTRGVMIKNFMDPDLDLELDPPVEYAPNGTIQVGFGPIPKKNNPISG